MSLKTLGATRQGNQIGEQSEAAHDTSAELWDFLQLTVPKRINSMDEVAFNITEKNLA